MSDTFTILAIFAHPDDEIGVGSTLAHYSAAGVRTVLTCASRGEAATIYCDECATRENLAEVRTRELECACAHLGIAELHWLDWPDGGIQALPRAEAVGQVVAQIRAIRPDVIVTHPENGLYPHPDHLAVWEITRAAFDAAANPDRYPDAGAPWAAARLFTRALPQSFFDAAPEFAQYRVELNGQQLPFFATPDAEIDVVMHVTPWAPQRQAAWDCHRSQHNPDSAFARMPDGLRSAMAENEHFVLAAARAPLPDGTPDGVGDDLLAGLTAELEAPAADPAFLAALRAELAMQRGYLAIYDTYLRQAPEPHLADLLNELVNQGQEVIYLLSRTLRTANVATGDSEADERIAARGRRRRNADAKVRVLLASAKDAVTGIEARVARATDPAQRAIWEELVALAQAQLQAIEAFAENTAMKLRR